MSILDEIPSNKTDHPQVTGHSLMYIGCGSLQFIEVSSSNLAQTIYIYKILHSLGSGEIWVVTIVTIVTWMIENKPKILSLLGFRKIQSLYRKIPKISPSMYKPLQI